VETELKIVRQKDVRRKVRERFLRPRIPEMHYWRNIKRLGVSGATELLLVDVSTRELKAWADFGRELGRNLRGQAALLSVEPIIKAYHYEMSRGDRTHVGALVAAYTWTLTSKRAQTLGSRGFIFRGDPNWEGLPSLWEQLPRLDENYIIPTDHILRCWPEPVVPDKL
jgi:hypothetical protein